MTYLYEPRSQVFLEVKEGVIVGRDPDADMVLPDRSVSRRHARVERSDTGYVLRDLESSHGLVVQGERVSVVSLKPGLQISLGRVWLEVRDEITSDHTPPRGEFPPAALAVDPVALRSDYERLRVVYELTKAIDVDRDLDRVLHRILDVAFRLLTAERGTIEVFEGGGEPRRLSATRSGPTSDVHLSRTVVEGVVGDKRGVIVEDTLLDERLSRAESICEEGVRSVMCVPLLYEDEVLGVIQVDSMNATHAFDERDLSLFGTVGSHAALILKDVMLRDALLRAKDEASARLKRILDELPCGVVLVDEERRLQVANPAARQILPLLGSMQEERLRRLGDTDLEDVLSHPGMELRPDDPDGRHVLVHGARIHNEVVLTLQDVTELRMRQEREAHQERLALVGQIAGGIAHDFNSLLTVMINGASFLRLGATHPEMREEAVAVLEAAERAAALVKQLLTYSRRDSVERRELQVDQRVADGLDLLERVLPLGVSLERSLSAGEACVWMDPTHLDRVLMNLVQNASDAVGTQGCITVRTEALHLTSSDVGRPQELAPGDYIVLEVVDDGQGMSEVTLERVFEPFFSTKAVGKGTGLGLATVLGVVERAGGHIAVRSTPGAGATFTVFLPQAKS